MTFNVFGRDVAVERKADGWLAYYLSSEGKRRRAREIVIPSDLAESEIEQYLGDLCHEWASPKAPRVVRLS